MERYQAKHKPNIRLHCPQCDQYQCRMLFGPQAVVVGKGGDPLEAYIDWAIRLPASAPERRISAHMPILIRT